MKYKNLFESLIEKYTIEVSQSGKDVHTPIDGSKLGAFNENFNQDLDESVEILEQTFKQWKNYPAPKRGEMIRLFGNAVREAKDDLSKMITLENGKVYQESLGEIQEVIDICDFAVGQSRQLYGLTMPSERQDHRMQEMWNPYGIVGVVSAFNFPAAVWSWNFAIATIGGNVVLWKPSPKTPFISLMLKSIWDKTCDDANLSWAKNVLRLHMGTNAQAENICLDSRIRVVSLTGSTEMGRTLAPMVQKRFGRLIMELGGNNAMIVTPEANLRLAVKSIVFSAVGTSGQRCTSLRRLIAHNSIKKSLTEKVVKAYATIKPADPFNEDTLMGPMINKEAIAKMQEVLEHCRNNGHTVHGGEVVGDTYVNPAVVELSKPDDIVQQETFAPILYVIGYENIDEAIEIQNGVPQGLSSCIFTDNLQEAERFIGANGSDCGIVNVNIGPSGAEIGGAFGGEKDTGGGRESGSDAWKQYMKRSTVTINYGDDLPLAQGVKFDV
jgi:aldehyde dehydrogenase (NAD+)